MWAHRGGLATTEPVNRYVKINTPTEERRDLTRFETRQAGTINVSHNVSHGDGTPKSAPQSLPAARASPGSETLCLAWLRKAGQDKGESLQKGYWMNLNAFADGASPLDMTASDEFASLCQSAADLSIPHDVGVPYASRNVVVRQQRFHVLEWGAASAPPVMALHGGHQSAHSWDLVNLHLANKYHVVAPDQRGHGDSEWARDAEYTADAMALDAAALIGELGLEKPVIMGHSMGGRNTLTLALAHPELCRALIVVDVGPEISDEGRKTIGSFIRANAEFDDLDHFVENVQKYDPYRSREHIERTVKYNLFVRADGKYVSKCDRAPRRLGLHERPAAPDTLTLDAVRSLQMPVLVVRGESSNILAPDAAERFVDALPNGQLVTVPNCGHNVHSQNTLGFIDVVGEFLAGLDAS